MLTLVRVVAALTAVAFSAVVHAQAFPSKPLRLVVPFPPGAGTDMFARVLAHKLSESLGQPVVVDNRPGGGATIGTDIVAKSPPDGYTLLLSTTSHAINPSVYSKLPYDTLRDFATVTQVATVPIVLVVHPSLPVTTAQELVALARSRPGELNVGSSSSGTVFHLAAELLKSTAGIDMVHVPFKGGSPALAALLANQVNVLFETSLTVGPQAKAGKLRPLAVGGLKRSSAMPELPTLAESGFPGFSAENWYGVYVPAGTPREIVKRLNRDIVNALSQPDVRERFASQGAELIGNTPEQHEEFLRAEMAKWARIARLANAHAD
ncbi:MAG TPA: tripartite tricarboxylate transporter substrate binding protein [Burkholderiales bacterium]|nr:tripartite tricarboxylate transporter substrate binding protein [Burkholderiales bacterium]